MGEKQLKIEITTETKSQDLRAVSERISETHTQELIVALCGPIGSDIHFIAEKLGQLVDSTFAYTPQIIKLSDFIKKFSKSREINEVSSKFDYYNNLIEAGNDLRKRHGNTILAELAINEIAYNREVLKETEKEENYVGHRVCYIIDSIKNTEEYELLRLIYRDIFYFIGVFSSLETREKNLIDKGLRKDQVYRLIDKDSGEDIHFGQKVSDTFIQADLFLRIEQTTSGYIENKLLRFLNIVFKTEVITPTFQETAMYLAASASGNSACLSRQVGASITDKIGEILSVGWNDVPKSGGGVYRTSNNDLLGNTDFRCINLSGGICHNDEEKRIIREALVNELIVSKLVDESKREELVEKIKKSRIKELIEFSRAVHAEMLAIIQASQKAGDRVIGGKLFCTTYPCHNCARHIVAAGIKEVYYIEPYRKSLATKLHSDSITEDENQKDKVQILMYDGISPNRYLEFFKMIPNSRKQNGKKYSEPKKTSLPKNTISLQAIPILEKNVTESLRDRHILDI